MSHLQLNVLHSDLNEIIERYKNEINKYSKQTPADLPIEHKIKLIDNQPVTVKYRSSLRTSR